MFNLLRTRHKFRQIEARLQALDDATKPLLLRQQGLQDLSRQHGNREFDGLQLSLAYATEVGEFYQCLKPRWAWWSKPGMVQGINPEDLLDEAADVLHFSLISGLFYQPAHHLFRLAALDELERGGWRDAAHFLIKRNTQEPAFVLAALTKILQPFGLSHSDLLTAYEAKALVNIQRWERAAELARQEALELFL